MSLYLVFSAHSRFRDSWGGGGGGGYVFQTRIGKGGIICTSNVFWGVKVAGIGFQHFQAFFSSYTFDGSVLEIFIS